MKHIIVSICYISVYSLLTINANAQTVSSHLQTQLDQRKQIQGMGAQRTTSLDSRLIGNYDGTANSSGTIINNDSSTYTYSGTRAGLNVLSIGIAKSHGMYIDGNFDKGYNWLWNSTTHTYDSNQTITNTYDAASHQLSQLTQVWSGTAWINSSRTIFYLDAAGLDTLDVGATWNTGTMTWVNYNLNRYAYDAAGRDTLVVSQTWLSPPGIWYNTFRTHYTYTTAGYRQTTLQEQWNGLTNSWRNYSSFTWVYSTAGYELSLTEMAYDTVSSTWGNAYQGVYYYNSSNQTIGSVSRNGSGTTWTNFDSASITSLSSSGDPLISLGYTWSSGSWQLNTRSTQTFFGPGLGATNIIELWTGSSYNNISKWSMSYNSYNKLTDRYFEGWNGTAWVTKAGNTHEHFYYETFTAAVPNVSTATMQVNLYPVPANENITVSINLPVSQQITAMIYDCSGKIYSQWTDQCTSLYRKDVSVRDIPSGIYILKIIGQSGQCNREFTVWH